MGMTVGMQIEFHPCLLGSNSLLLATQPEGDHEMETTIYKGGHTQNKKRGGYRSQVENPLE